MYLLCILSNLRYHCLNLSHHYLAAKSLQSCPTLCDTIDSSPPGSPIPGILQARTLEWVAISFSNAGKWKVKVNSLSHDWLLAIPWTTAYQAPPSVGFSRQEYWSGVPLPSPPLSYVSTKKKKKYLETIIQYCFITALLNIYITVVCIQRRKYKPNAKQWQLLCIIITA